MVNRDAAAAKTWVGGPMRSGFDASFHARSQPAAGRCGSPLSSGFSESVHEVHEGLQSRLSIMRMEASLTKVSAVRVRFSKSFARRRQRLSQANVRSTIQRLGRTSKPLA